MDTLTQLEDVKAAKPAAVMNHSVPLSALVPVCVTVISFIA